MHWKNIFSIQIQFCILSGKKWNLSVMYILKKCLISNPLQKYALSQQQQNPKYDENEEEDDDETGNEYGDVNDRSHEGEEFLDKIDYYSLRIFPIIFALANIPYWLSYLPKYYNECAGPDMW